ncbi:oxidoreductase [Nocardia mangyaensis]|uniref:Oxidoreductase n=1 Tax=Nocardia mangyaensis TaxID=2213200 RepID=A0A1J0VQQ3_9NOCA|nr:PDR/VanB family oxidoreductase [Nocardia mangyaensis]APE34345.1 oxidoreductase [Nocardia mangyaensis]
MHTSDLLTVLVRDRRRLADDIDEFTLARLDGAPLPAWTPGAHIDLLLDEAVVRQYSLCSDPADTGTYRIAVLREAAGRGGSVLAHALAIGATVSIRPPRNHFPLVRALGYVLIAGGVGITPILALAAEAARGGRPWRLIYTGRDEPSMAYADEVAQRYPAATIQRTARDGRLDLAAVLAGLAPGTAVYVCGPPGLIEAAERACAGQLAVDVFAERFVARELDVAADAAPFEVSLAVSGLTITVDPGSSILAAVEAQGVATVASCREGTCGTCETEVVSGEVDHRDSVLSPAERAESESMMICVSRSASARLVLEL